MTYKTLATLIALLAALYSAQADNPLISYRFNYGPDLHVMKMGSTKEIEIYLYIESIKGINDSTVPFTVKFAIETLAPQFSILTLDNATTNSHELQINSTRKANILPLIHKVKLKAEYIGHALLKPIIEDEKHLFEANKPGDNLHIVIIQDEGVWGLVFKISVPLVIIISYINLGAQIDTENMRELLKKPKTIILGFILTVFVMPLISWFVGRLLLSEQLLYRIGSFVYACGPAATASTLWTIMLKADKELSIGLQVISTFSALATMPMFLYFMDRTMQAEQHGHHSIQVPYIRLIQTLAVLMLALFVGWRFIGRYEKAQKISRRVFRPLTFAVLIFIIVFSSMLYWFIYKMFDWNITLVAVAITLATYLISGILGYLINFNIDHAIAIAIGSAYKNEGIAFAVLFVAFGQPDLYIAYVPCLTQVVVTSLFSYLAYCFMTFFNYLRRRGQPAPIQATKSDEEETKTEAENESQVPKKETRSGSKSSEDSNKSSNGGNDEFIAMNVTDVPAG